MNSFRTVFSRNAILDLSRMISDGSVSSETAYMIRECSCKLERTPYDFPISIIPALFVQNIRLIDVSGFKIGFTVDETTKTVRIARIIHSERDLKRIGSWTSLSADA